MARSGRVEVQVAGSADPHRFDHQSGRRRGPGRQADHRGRSAHLPRCYYRTDPAGGLELVDAPDGQWSSLPVFPSGAGGLVSTVDDWHSFARMLLAGGSVGGRQLLSPASVRQMTTD
jgi:CubicO group peptidase (beta-lactamase class C family)